MTTYICKCGRQVKKATNADNTGNRDTEGCKGCPYLLPWGPDKYIEGQGYTKDVQGYECRMSPTISYTTTYRGQANDKCTLHILSLDLDFLDEVQAWIYDNAADTLSAGFSRGSMRGIDFSDKGRYSLSISCTQNKKGMAAKAALLERFFTNGRVRKDKTLVQEKAHILASIKKGKENASKMNYIISEHSNGLLYAYYKGLFWFWHKDQNKWVPSDFARLKYEQAKAKDGKITPEDILDNGEFFALEEYQVPLKLRTALEALTPADSKIPAPDAEGAGTKENTNEETADCLCSTCTCTGCHENCFHNCTACGNPVTECNSYQTEGEKRLPASAEPPEIVDECSEPDEGCPYLQPLENSKKYSCQCAICGDKFVNREICNKSFRSCGWYLDRQDKEAQTEDDEEEASTADVCQCRTCGRESCFAHGCAKECPSNAEESCLTVICPEYIEKAIENPTAAAVDVPPCAPTASDAQTSPCQSADAGAKTGAEESVENPTPAAPASRADVGAAEQSLSAAGPASLEADERMENPTSSDVATVAAGGTVASLEPSDSTSMMAAPAAKANEPKDDATESVLAMASGLTTFDFGADAETNAALMQDAQIFMAGSMARVMAAKRAHDRTANNYRGSWGKWCDLVGISRDTGDNMVRVAENFGNMELDGKPLIEVAPFSLLAVAAKPSAPAELVQAVKDGDITTHKQYQEALARIRTLENQNASLLHSYETERGKAEAADRRAEEEQRKRKEADEGCASAMETLRQAQEDAANADARARAAEHDRDEARRERDGARDALQAVKLRGDRLKAENDDLKARPIEAAVVDEDEVNRRAEARAQEVLAAKLTEQREISARNAEDAIILLGRQINTAWQMVRPFLAEMDELQRVEAVDRINKEWAQTQKEIMQCL